MSQQAFFGRCQGEAPAAPCLVIIAQKINRSSGLPRLSITMPHRLAQWPLKLLVATAAGVMLLLLPKAAWAFRPTGAGASASTPRSSSPSSSLSSPQSRASIIRRAGGGQAQSQAQAQQQQPQGPLTRRSMLTVGHDAAVQTALPLLFGRWTLKVRELRGGGRVFAWGSRRAAPNSMLTCTCPTNQQHRRIACPKRCGAGARAPRARRWTQCE